MVRHVKGKGDEVDNSKLAFHPLVCLRPTRMELSKERTPAQAMGQGQRSAGMSQCDGRDLRGTLRASSGYPTLFPHPQNKIGPQVLVGAPDIQFPPNVPAVGLDCAGRNVQLGGYFLAC